MSNRFIKFLDHSGVFRGIFSVRVKKIKVLFEIQEKKKDSRTLNFISILSISPPIRSTIFSPCFSMNVSTSSIVSKFFISYTDVYSNVSMVFSLV